jgi:lipoate synthase
LRKIITFKERKDLEDKMANVFQENLKGLSTELRRILLDDLVTAFQSRINVLTRVQKKASY